MQLPSTPGDKQAASAPGSDRLVGAAQSRISYPIPHVELCQMPWQTCSSLQKSCVGVCVLWKVMFKRSGRGKHKTEEETLENTLNLGMLFLFIQYSELSEIR